MPPKAVSQETYLEQTDGTFSAGNGCAALAADSAVIALVPGGSEGFFCARGGVPGAALDSSTFKPLTGPIRLDALGVLTSGSDFRGWIVPSLFG